MSVKVWKLEIKRLFSVYFNFLKYKTNRFQVAVRLFSNRSEKTSKWGKNISDTQGAAEYATFLFLPHFDVLCDLLLNCQQLLKFCFNTYYTHLIFSFQLHFVVERIYEILYILSLRFTAKHQLRVIAFPYVIKIKSWLSVVSKKTTKKKQQHQQTKNIIIVEKNLKASEIIDCTCTIASISSISRFACANVWSVCVITSSIYMTFARVRFAFVNICQKIKIKREKNEKCESVFIHESREKKR